MSKKEYVQERVVEEEEYEGKRKEKKPIEKKPLTTEAKREVKPVITPIFNIKLREVGKITVGKPKTPNIILKELKLLKLNIRPVNTILTEPLKLRVKIPRVEELTSVRVSVYEPLTVQIYSLLQPQIKIRPLRDFSVRPLLEPERINLAKIKASLPRVWLPLTLQLKLLPLISIGQQPPLKPKLKLLPLEFSKEEALLKHGREEELPPRIKLTEAPAEIAVERLPPEFSGLPESLLDERYLDEDYRESGGLGGVSSEGLVCILADKSRGFHEFIKLLCAKVWRIKGRGMPSVAHRGYSEELGSRGLEEDIVELSQASRLLEALAQDVSKVETLNEIKKEFESEVKSRSIEGRLRFILLPVEEKLFEKAYRVLTDPNLEIEPYLRHAKLLAYKLGKVDDEFLERLLISAFGFAKITPHTSKIGHTSLELEREFYNRLEDAIRWVRKNVSAVYQPKPGSEYDRPEESWLHWALKHLTYQHLICNEKIEEHEIESEKKEVLPSGKEKIIDVYTTSGFKPIAIEIETMYGTGDPIGAKINPLTVNPYLGFEGELWLLIPNLHALMYAKDLLKLKRDYVKEGLKLEVYVADVTGWGSKLIYGEKRSPGLVKLKDVLKFIREGSHKFRQVLSSDAHS